MIENDILHVSITKINHSLFFPGKQLDFNNIGHHMYFFILDIYSFWRVIIPV